MKAIAIIFAAQRVCRYPGLHVAILVFLALSPALLFSFGYHNDFWAWAYPAATCCSRHPESAITMAVGRWLAALVLNIQFMSIDSLVDLWRWRLINITTTVLLALYYLTIVQREFDAKVRSGSDIWLTVAIFTLPTMQLHAVWAANFAYFTPPLLFALFGADAGLRAMAATDYGKVAVWLSAAVMAVLAALFFYPPSATFILVPAAHRLLFRAATNRERRYALLSAAVLSAGYIGFFATHRFLLLPRFESLPSLGDYHFAFNDSLIREALVRFVSYVYEAAYLSSPYELAWLPYLVAVGCLLGLWILALQPTALIRELAGNLALVVGLLALASAPMLLAYKFSTSFRVMFTVTALLLMAGWRLTLSQLRHIVKLEPMVASFAVVTCFAGVWGVSQLADWDYRQHASVLSKLSKDAFHAIVLIRPAERKRFHDLELRGDFGNLNPISAIGDQLIGSRFNGRARFDIAEFKVSKDGVRQLMLEQNAVVVDTRAAAGLPIVPLEALLAGLVRAEPRGDLGPMSAVDRSPYSFWEAWGRPFPIILELALDAPKRLRGYRLTAYEELERMPSSWEVWSSVDLEHWSLLDQRQIDHPWKAGEVREFKLPDVTTAKGVRLLVTASAAGHGVRLYEFTLLPASH